MNPTKESLVDMIRNARKGHVVLPEFQRSFIWDRQSIEELLVSIFNGYFIGSLLILRVLPEDHPFKARKIEGAEDGELYPKRMVLDGQQRLTSIHYALHGPDLHLKNTKYPYRFFVRIPRAAQEEWEEAVYSKSAARSSTEELYENREAQFDKNVLPLAALRSWPTWSAWYDAYRDYHKERGSFDKALSDRIGEFARQFLNFNVAVVELPEHTELDTVVEIFERINRTGESLSVFELLTARLWKDDINLRDLWRDTRDKFAEIDAIAGDKSERYPKFALQVMALLRGEECKRKDLILLDAEDFVTDWMTANKYIDKALSRIRSTGEGGYGVVPSQSLPYSTMVPPLAAIIHALESKYRGDPRAFKKAHQWYWSSVFAQRYGGSTATITQRDYHGVLEWIEDDEAIPEAVVTDASQLRTDLREVVRKGAVYKGVLSLAALAGARDFYTGDSIEHAVLDDHHIFPKTVLKERGVQADQRNAVVNRTLISRDTNQNFIKAKPPSQYLGEMEARHGTEECKKILETHLIDEDAYAAMKADDYDAFRMAREEVLNEAIVDRCTGLKFDGAK